MTTDYISAYLNTRRTLNQIEETNTRNLSSKQLELILLMGKYPDRAFTEKDIRGIFGYSASSVADSVSELIHEGFAAKEEATPGVTRNAVVKLTHNGLETYDRLSTEIQEAIKSDLVGRQPIF